MLFLHSSAQKSTSLTMKRFLTFFFQCISHTLAEENLLKWLWYNFFLRIISRETISRIEACMHTTLLTLFPLNKINLSRKIWAKTNTTWHTEQQYSRFGVLKGLRYSENNLKYADKNYQMVSAQWRIYS